MIREKKFVTVVFCSLVVLLFSISIGYATLSTTLMLTASKFTQEALTWDIAFVSGTITGTAVVNNSNSISCGTATATSTSISGISPILSDVGDKCAYEFTVRNDGTIAGEISSINVTKPLDTCTISGSTMVCGDITYKLHYDTASSTNLVSAGDTIDAKSGGTATTKTVVLTIEYSGATAAEDDFTQSGFSYTITYGQK